MDERPARRVAAVGLAVDVASVMFVARPSPSVTTRRDVRTSCASSAGKDRLTAGMRATLDSLDATLTRLSTASRPTPVDQTQVALLAERRSTWKMLLDSLTPAAAIRCLGQLLVEHAARSSPRHPVGRLGVCERRPGWRATYWSSTLLVFGSWPGAGIKRGTGRDLRPSITLASARPCMAAAYRRRRIPSARWVRVARGVGAARGQEPSAAFRLGTTGIPATPSATSARCATAATATSTALSATSAESRPTCSTSSQPVRPARPIHRPATSTASASAPATSKTRRRARRFGSPGSGRRRRRRGVVAWRDSSRRSGDVVEPWPTGGPRPTRTVLRGWR